MKRLDSFHRIFLCCMRLLVSVVEKGGYLLDNGDLVSGYNTEENRSSPRTHSLSLGVLVRSFCKPHSTALTLLIILCLGLVLSAYAFHQHPPLLL